MPSVRIAAFALALTLGIGVPSAQAYKLAKIEPQPQLKYYVALPDWKGPFDRVVAELNRQQVGVKLVKAKIPEQASIQVGRLEKQCGLPGVDGTTQTLEGGYAAIYLPRGCSRTTGTIIVAHELGHALGLLHEDRRCALMNSSGTAPTGIPSHCAGQGFDWAKHPFRADDLAGLKKLFHDTPPTGSIKLTTSKPTNAVSAFFRVKASDKENNVSELRIDWGDGSPRQTLEAGTTTVSHLFTKPGTYTVKLTVVDLFLKQDVAKTRVVVADRSL